MGRVYKALMKAEQLKGQPPSTDQTAFGDVRQTIKDTVATRPVEIRTVQAPSRIHDQKPFDFDNAATAFPFSYGPEVRPAVQPQVTPELSRAAGRPAGPAVTPNTGVTPGVATAPSFVEPRRIARVAELAVDPHLPALAGADELAVERYRTLAIRLLNVAADRRLKTLLITSAEQGEGKTTIATSLAWVLASEGRRRVLLIDLNLSNPSVGRVLGINTERGWLDLLESNASLGLADLAGAALRVDPNGLYVLTPRSVRASASRAVKETGKTINPNAEWIDPFTSSRIEEFLKELEQYFDLIVVDAPPIGESAEAQRLASLVDGAALVVRAGHTRHEVVGEALKLVPKKRRLGVVLNESDTDETPAPHSREKRSGLGRLLKARR